MLIYLVSLWFVGIGGGMWLGVWQENPLKSEGFWIASAGGLLLAGICLALLLAHVMRQRNALELTLPTMPQALPGTVGSPGSPSPLAQQ